MTPTQDSNTSAIKRSTASSSLLRAYAEKTRRDPSDPYAWAMTHRRYAGGAPLHVPALAGIYRDDHPLVVVQKSAQIGLTELLVNRALWAADTAYANRGNVLLSLIHISEPTRP